MRACVRAYVCEWVSVRVCDCASVCVCEREREREREHASCVRACACVHWYNHVAIGMRDIF